MMLPWNVEPHVTCKLLLTAAVRQHVDELQYWLRSHNFQHWLDAATYEAVYKQLLMYDLSVELPSREKLPAAAQLSSDAIARLLTTAAEHCRTEKFLPLVSEHAAVELSSEQVGNVLLAVLQHARHWGPRVKVTGFEYVYHEDQLLEVRAKDRMVERAKGLRNCLQMVCRLPGADTVRSNVWCSLLLAAL
jgi:hypothetical protein